MIIHGCFLLDLCSGINTDGIWGPYKVLAIKHWLVKCKTNAHLFFSIQPPNIEYVLQRNLLKKNSNLQTLNQRVYSLQ